MARNFMFIKLIKTIKDLRLEIIVFLISLIIRIPRLGTDFFNNDVWAWKLRAYKFGEAFFSFNFADTLVTYHPGVPLTWLVVLGIKLFTLADMFYYKGQLSQFDLVLALHTYQKFVVVIFISILLTILFNLSKKIFNSKIALLGIAFLLSEPYYLFLSREVHNDALLSLFIGLSLLSYFLSFRFKDQYKNKFLKIFKNKYIIYSGIWAALALLTKSAALFLVPFYIIWSLIEYFLNKKSKAFTSYIGLIVITVLTFVLVWPAMWVVPLKALSWYFELGVEKTAIIEGHSHIWFGVETIDPGFWFYPIVLIGRFSPFVVLIIVSGLLLALLKDKVLYKIFKSVIDIIKRKEISSKFTDDNLFMIFSWGFFIGFFIMLTIAGKKLDRYVLPMIFPVLLSSLYYIIKYFHKNLVILIFSISMIVNIGTCIILHPNYNAYYSPLIGGMDAGKNILEPKWPVGCDIIAAKFNAMLGERPNLGVAYADYLNLTPFAKFRVLNIQNKPEADKADFFVLPVYSQVRNEFYKSTYNLKRRYDLDIYVGPVLYYEVYEYIKL